MSKLAERLRGTVAYYTPIPHVAIIDDAVSALDAAEKALRQYADSYCELGHAAEACGKLADDECGGCLAIRTLARLEGK